MFRARIADNTADILTSPLAVRTSCGFADIWASGTSLPVQCEYRSQEELYARARGLLFQGLPFHLLFGLLVRFQFFLLFLLQHPYTRNLSRTPF